MSDNITIRAGAETISYNRFLFNGGEVSIKLDTRNLRFFTAAATNHVQIKARITSSEDLMALVMIKGALDEIFTSWSNRPKIDLLLPYFPYGRQDRVCDKGEAFGAREFARIINLLAFHAVVTIDDHSAVTHAVLNNHSEITQASLIAGSTLNDLFLSEEPFVLVSPDAGASKKVAALAKYFGRTSYLRTDKKRDLATGKILECVLHDEGVLDPTPTYIIVDDICDKGGTFIQLAARLRDQGAKRVILYVTHAILPDGPNDVLAAVDEIWTTDSFRADLADNPKIKVLKLENLDHL